MPNAKVAGYRTFGGIKLKTHSWIYTVRDSNCLYIKQQNRARFSRFTSMAVNEKYRVVAELLPELII